jgi:hypothetical protein
MGLDGWGNDTADWLDENIGNAQDFYQGDVQNWVWNGSVNTIADVSRGFSDLFRVGSGTGHALYDCDDNGYGRAANVLMDVGRAAGIFSLLAGPAAKCTGKPGAGPPKNFNPFKGKTPPEIEDMLLKKGYNPAGPDPLNGKGGYVNPRNSRSYHIDEANSYGEPPHVDVNRLRSYKGPLDKRKFWK